MEKSDWGYPGRIWGLEKTYDAGRMISIYEAIKELPINSVVDIACGCGIIADGLKWMRPEWSIYQFDIVDYPEWKSLNVVPEKRDIHDLMESDEQYDLALFLNSFRNWDEQEEFRHWMKGKIKYFITSGLEGGKVVGQDTKGFTLRLYEV